MNILFSSNDPVWLFILGFTAIGIGIFNYIQLRKMNRFQKALFTSKNGIDLENLLVILEGRLKSLEQESSTAAENIANLYKQLQSAIQKIGIVKYSAFTEKDGGDYSFSLALLDNEHNGLVLTNIYGRQQSRIYTKQIKHGKSNIPVTEEESSAINQAITNEYNKYTHKPKRLKSLS